MKDYIQLRKNNILKYGLKDEDGKKILDSKGKQVFLSFDIEDIEFPLKLNTCEAKHRKNIETLKMKFAIVDKKEDKKGKYILSWKEEEKIKVLKEFYEEEMKALDLFLGENGTKKILNGRNPYFSMYEDINDMLKPILPSLKQNVENISDKIRKKYSKNNNENVMK